MMFSLLELALPGANPAPAGVLLFDEAGDRLGVKMRRDWSRLSHSHELEEEDALLLSGIEREIKRHIEAHGGHATLSWLEESLSNVFRLSPRQPLPQSAAPLSFDFLLHRLYRDRVPSIVEPFVTHLPRYAIRSAAGPFAEQWTEDKNEAADWVEAPVGLRLGPDMFVAEVHGQSMEPRIPSGSLCIFRKIRPGSRNGKMVLVEDRQARGGTGYTVKIYHSEKSTPSPDQLDETWRQSRIWLESLNPDFPPIELHTGLPGDEGEEGRYAVRAEFVSLLDESLLDEA